MANPYRGVGRNDPCPCGSGKKFKRCCLNSEGLKAIASALDHFDPQVEEGARPALEPTNESIRDYDPFEEPPPGEWLAMDEQQRINLVLAYHRRAGIRFPRENVHAVIHVVVENQIADDELPVRRTAERLMSEGLDRHEAVHAIGSVLAGHLNDLVREARSGRHVVDADSDRDPNQTYFAELEALTADGWLQSG